MARPMGVSNGFQLVMGHGGTYSWMGHIMDTPIVRNDDWGSQPGATQKMTKFGHLHKFSVLSGNPNDPTLRKIHHIWSCKPILMVDS